MADILLSLLIEEVMGRLISTATEEIIKKLKPRSIALEPELRRSSPFVDEIANARLPMNLKIPKFKLFNNESDPANHVIHYTQLMAKWEDDDAVMCRCFGASLQGISSIWLGNLPVGQIRSFAELPNAFKREFDYLVVVPSSVYSLMIIRQQPGERLVEFNKRFVAKVKSIPRQTEEVLMSSYTQSILMGRFKSDLLVRKPLNMRDIYERAEGFQAVEDLEMASYPMMAPTMGKQGQKRPRSPPKKPEKKRNVEPRTYGKWLSLEEYRNRKFDPLGVTLSVALDVLIKKKILELPDTWGKSKSKPPLNPKAFCAYHRFYDHDTKSCRTLKHKIQNIIDDGKLPEELRVREKRFTAADKGKEVEDQELLGKLNAITGLFDKKTRQEQEKLQRAQDQAGESSGAHKVEVLQAQV